MKYYKYYPVEVRLSNSNVQIPKYATLNSVGLDLQADINDVVIINPFDRLLVSTGVSITIPFGYEGQIRPRSGLASKYGITLINSPGTIDSDYRGEIKLSLINLSRGSFTLRPGDRVAQLVVSPIIKVKLTEVKCSIEEWIGQTQRGDGGFGSTGI